MVGAQQGHRNATVGPRAVVAIFVLSRPRIMSYHPPTMSLFLPTTALPELSSTALLSTPMAYIKPRSAAQARALRLVLCT